MRWISSIAFICGSLALAAPGHAAGKYAGWTGQDCVNMGKNCIASCDRYGVPETKASCMFNCTSTAMQCVDVVKGEAAEMSSGDTGPPPSKTMRRAPMGKRQVGPAR